MYRLFAQNRKAVDVYQVLDLDCLFYDKSSWRCSITSTFPISGFLEFKYFRDFFDFISMLQFRYPDTILTIYYKSSKL